IENVDGQSEVYLLSDGAEVAGIVADGTEDGSIVNYGRIQIEGTAADSITSGIRFEDDSANKTVVNYGIIDVTGTRSVLGVDIAGSGHSVSNSGDIDVIATDPDTAAAMGMAGRGSGNQLKNLAGANLSVSGEGATAGGAGMILSGEDNAAA